MLARVSPMLVTAQRMHLPSDGLSLPQWDMAAGAPGQTVPLHNWAQECTFTASSTVASARVSRTGTAAVMSTTD